MDLHYPNSLPGSIGATALTEKPEFKFNFLEITGLLDLQIFQTGNDHNLSR